MKKYCTKCGHEFEAVGREVICPACKAQAAEEVKKAAVLRAKRASWTGESVPVRISGRASTVIREFGASHTMTFAEALDALLRTTDYFLGLDKAWVDIMPYKSRRRDKATSTPDTPQDGQTAQDVSQDVTSKPQEPQDPPHDVKQAAKTTSKASASKATSKASKDAPQGKPQAAKAAKAVSKSSSKSSSCKK